MSKKTKRKQKPKLAQIALKLCNNHRKMMRMKPVRTIKDDECPELYVILAQAALRSNR